MTALSLRPYQTQLLNDLRMTARRGIKKVLLQLIMGGGKTVTIAALILAAVTKGARILYIAHREELIHQPSRKLDALGVDHGIVMANHPRWRPHAPVQVASRDTLVRRINKPTFNIGEFQIVIIDEAHHAMADTYGKIIARWPDAWLIGMTATPLRLDGKGLADLFEEMVCGPQPRELIDLGYLVSTSGFAYELPDLRGVKKARGDYNQSQLENAMRQVVLGGSIIRDYIAHANGKRALCFAVSVEHSMAIVEQANAAGVQAEHVDANTPDVTRDAILGPNGRLSTGETLIVSNVGIATEGTDIPAIEVGILARPTASESLAMQMMGRVMRPYCFDCRDAPGPHCREIHRIKERALIHDHAGVIMKSNGEMHHGLPDDDRFYTLDATQPAIDIGEKKMKICPKCHATVPGATRHCECGHRFPFTEGMGSQTSVVEHEDADRIDLDELRKRRPAGARELSDRQLRKVMRATPEERAAEYLRLRRVREDKGFKEGFVGNAYREIFGEWPKFSALDLVDVEPADRPFIPLPPREREDS